MSTKNFPLVFKTHPRSRRLTLRITSDLKVLVTIPRGVNVKVATKFVEEHGDWIAREFERLHSVERLPEPTSSHELTRAKIRARQLVHHKLLHFNTHYHFTYLGVSIRSQRTRWGSCSRHRHLSFNYRIIFLPEVLQNYIIVHELCHLKEMNHSSHFWKLVQETIPAYLELRRELKKIRL